MEITKLPKDMKGNKCATAPEYLFKTEGAEINKLDKFTKSESFHNIIAMI